MATLVSHHKTLSSSKSSLAFTYLTRSTVSPPSPFSTLSLTQECRNHLHPALDLLLNIQTLYLFTKSDFKTVLLPVTVFASIMAPLNRVQCLPRIVFWIWLHLLQFCVSNQCINPEEDAVNKPWRPIPAGRVTVSQAQNLRWVLVAACLALSIYRGVLPASILLCSFTIAYNDLGLHRHIVMRNACNAVGYASFELGATQLAAGNSYVCSSGVVPLIASALIVFTTIHAADFRDEEGDRLEGKRTLPISFPEGSRIVMLASLVLWSSALSLFWNLDAILASVLLITGAAVGLRFIYRRNAAADRMSYLLYNVWLSLAHICLGVGQYRGRGMTAFAIQ
ncbi:UbiA prenyltransferase family-domain-containing protein [Gautieria morchelliformis]|nr:UbiA prenyltransferase family-domain-containing protein [Gautieria morchelliformis]